jgi:type IV secretory pathway VirJ component
MRILSGALLLLALINLSGQPAFAEESFAFERFGRVTLYRPTDQPSAVVLFLSGDGGWNKGVVDMARLLVRLDAAVVGIDSTRYLRSLEHAGDSCSYPAADLEALSKFVQMRLGLPRYLTPVLVGYSSGATLVYAVLAQAPPNTFAGAISMGFCADLPISKPFCSGRGLKGERGPRGKGYVFAPAHETSGMWIVLQGTIDQACSLDQAKRFTAEVSGAEIVPLPKVGHGFSVTRNWLPQFRTAFGRIREHERVHGGREQAAALDLPIVELAAKAPERDVLAVVLSGDGGWAGIDREIGETLAKSGIPVAGLNSLQYFWTARTPDSTAADVARLLRHYLRTWNKRRAVLIGYSFGADVLPFIVSRLPADLRESLALIVLIGPGKDANFEFHLTDWLVGSPQRSSLPILPEAEKLRGAKVLCLFGEEEKESLCRDLDQGIVERMVLKGGHHFGGHYRTITDRILSALP